ncbi:MAG: ABC transporter permease [Promicromonosporaceae bacterium]|nr:ABC transporter permease [Promicromonosporaceae bacterium]
MSTTTLDFATPTRPSRPRGFSKLLTTEARVWARDLANPFWVLLFPTVMLTLNLLGSDPTETPDVYYGHHYYGIMLIQVIAPAMLAIAMSMPFIGVMPVAFGQFREKGVLKRFSGSPMRPQALIIVHYLISALGALGGAAVMLGAAAIIWGLTIPGNIGVVVIAFLLGTLTMASIGTLVSARVAKATVANAIAMTVFFALLVAAGLMGGLMNETWTRIARFTPLGAATQAIEAGWFGYGFPVVETLVMVGWTILMLPLGVKLFRWR